MIRLTISDVDELKRIIDNVDNIEPVLPEIGEIIVASVQRNFSVGGRYGTDNEFGGGSNTWTPSLRAEKGGVTLNDTNILSNSITYNVVGPEELEVGTNIEYGAIHHYGGTIEAKQSPFLMFRLATGRFVMVKSVEIPERPFLVVQNEDLEEIAEAVIAHYNDRLTP